VLANFTAHQANQLWTTDITEHPTKVGKLSMCSLENTFSSRIVGYLIGQIMTSGLALCSLHNAITLRKPKGTICHSGRRNRPQRSNRVVPLTSAKQRSGFKEVRTQKWLRIATVTWIEGAYQRRMRKRRLRKMTLIDCEATHEVVDKELLGT
jgi:putative transposase